MDLTNWWVQTHQEKSSAEQMWDSWRAEHRIYIEAAVRLLPEAITSLYEVGCGSGPNLRRLKESFPLLTLGGSEPCEGMAAWASEHLGVTIDRLALPDVPQDPWDCILSCYALAYVDAEAAIQSLRDLKARYLILMEPTAYLDPYDQPGLYRRGACLPEYAHDWPHLLRAAGWSTLWRWPHLPPTDGLNAVTIAEQESV